jgi:hypothetical protein
MMAEILPGKWLALEATGGYVVRGTQNKRYYSGHSFASPKELREYSSLLRQREAVAQKYQKRDR